MLASLPGSAGDIGRGEAGPGEGAEDQRVSRERQQPAEQVDVSTGAEQGVEGEPPMSGHYGPSAASCGPLSTTSLAATRIMTVAMAPIECSVNVETASPIAPSAGHRGRDIQGDEQQPDRCRRLRARITGTAGRRRGGFSTASRQSIGQVLLICRIYVRSCLKSLSGNRCSIRRRSPFRALSSARIGGCVLRCRQSRR